ncbi:MAG: hypothetical protein IJJ99_03595 [Oscillospiraceae bacterium]|nr:hypothetical protein [Oscillospiraceae bacterium]
MNKVKTRRTILFVIGILLAGAIHVMDRLCNEYLNMLSSAEGSALPAFGSTVMFVLNFAIYCALLLWWIRSVYTRLLPSPARRCILIAGGMMLLFLLIRSVKYRLAVYASLLEHFCWYAFYVPMAFIPALFLATCLCMEPERRGRKTQIRLTLAAAALISLLVATNDLHYLMFHPIGTEVQGGVWNSYTLGPLWYLTYGFVIVCVLLGLTLLALADRRKHSGRKTLFPALILLGMLAILTLADRPLSRAMLASPWTFPEAAAFCMLGIFESCIRSRLIPFNENYIEYFAQLRLPAEITDPAQRTVYRTASPMEADAAARREALAAPILLPDGHTRLSGKRISSGYAFWTRDERALQALNRELADANEVLETENDLLRFETEQAKERLRVDTRNRLYAEADASVQGTQRRIGELLQHLQPERADYAETLAKVLLMNAYIKRKTNFVLQAAGCRTITAKELYLALEESSRFLCLCGVDSSAEQRTERAFSNAEAAALYDSFEQLAEAFAEQARHVLILLTDEGIRLMADCAAPFELPELPAAAELSAEDGLLYLTLRAAEGGAA